MATGWEKAADNGCIELLICDSAGIYVPKHFCAYFEGWSGIDPDDVKTCLNGPDDEWYWEAWDSILNNAYYVDHDSGDVWRLYQDGDLFAVKDGYNFED